MYALILQIVLLLAVPVAVKAQPLFEDFVKVEIAPGEAQYEVYVENLVYFPVTVTVHMTLQNLAASDSLPFTTSLQGKERRRAFELKLAKDAETGSYESNYNFIMGSRDARHDTSYVYHLPYRKGSAYKVAQGYFGKYSHDEGAEYAIDFRMKAGTPVCAAREGIVVGLYENSDKGGPHVDFQQHVNYIFIRHSDGTLGAYYHLQKNGVRVRIGQSVHRGQIIGYSGNSGFSFAPHLHFEVFKAIDGRQTQSFPIKFQTQEGIVSEPEENKAYIAR